MLFAPTFEVEDTLDHTIDDLLPLLAGQGEDLWETFLYAPVSGKWWLVFSDSEAISERVLHCYLPDGTYKRSTNGNVAVGLWAYSADTNKLEMMLGNQHELYQSYFLSPDFFILKKDGDAFAERRYLVLGYEASLGGLNWREYCLSLHDSHKLSSNYYYWVLAAVLVLAIVIGTLSC